MRRRSNIQQIYSETPGEAWIKVCKLVMREGKPIKDGELVLKEIVNLFAGVEKPAVEDEILKKWGNKEEREWMRRLWLETKPIPAMGRFPLFQISYGSRLLDVNKRNHLEWVINKLKANPEAKSATISTLFPGEEEKTSISCVTTLDFKIRNKKLITTAFVRSQDAYKKFHWDILMLGEVSRMIAEGIGVVAGPLNSFVISEHIYGSDFDEVDKLLKEVLAPVLSKT